MGASFLEPYRDWLDAREERPPVRVAYAAAHLVLAESYRDVEHSPTSPGTSTEIARHIDWDATMAIRARLDRLGFGIAEAMDTAQRFEIGWPVAERLIRECGRLSPRHGFIAGAGTDHVPDAGLRTIGDLSDAVADQARIIQDAGGVPMLLSQPWLTAHGVDADGYVDFYRRVIDRVDGPLCIHWLGAMFLPSLEGYFPGDSFARVMAIDPSKVRGCKLSLLDADLEVRIRRDLLERDQVVFTGDDYHFAGLILGGDASVDASGGAAGDGAAGDGVPTIDRSIRFDRHELALGDFSHALLGILDGIAVPASIALRLLAHGRVDDYIAVMERCERLSRVVFEPPTQHYKAGLAHLAQQAGLQDNDMLVNHQEQSRGDEHRREIVELARLAGALERG